MKNLRFPYFLIVLILIAATSSCDKKNVSYESFRAMKPFKGKVVEYKELIDQSGKLQMGDGLEKGIYFAHITDGKSISKSLKLIKQ